jgi:membrane protein YqaA with SNARE-associated domain
MENLDLELKQKDRRFGFTFRSKLIFGGIFLGTFLISGGFFMGYTDEIGSWGYFGAMIINFISSATIVFPSPGLILIMQMSSQDNWVILGLLTGISGGLGSATAYIVGLVGSDRFEGKLLVRWSRFLFLTRWGSFFLILTNLIPFAGGDALSLAAGVSRFPFRKYIIYVTLSTVIRMLMLTFIGANIDIISLTDIEYYAGDILKNVSNSFVNVVGEGD